MAKTVTRQTLKLFGKDGDVNNFGQFGSVDAGSPTKTKVIATIQALSAWLTGWQDAVVASNKAPFLEDMNSIMYVMFYQVFYALQAGVAEWDVGTSYFIGSVVRKDSSQYIYESLTDDNLGNALPADGSDSINWKQIIPVRFSDLTGSIAGSQIPAGTITDSKINDVAATKITGLILAAQIQSLAISQLTGGPLSVALGGTGVTKKFMVRVPYTGDGASSRSIAHGMGQTPDFVSVIRTDNSDEIQVMWDANMSGNNSRTWGGHAANNLIGGADATNVNLVGASIVNPNLVPMVLYCWKFQ